MIKLLFWISFLSGLVLIAAKAYLWNSGEKQIQIRLFYNTIMLDAYVLLKINYFYSSLAMAYCILVIVLVLFFRLGFAPIWPHLIISSICPLKCPECGERINLYRRLSGKEYYCAKCGNTRL